MKHAIPAIIAVLALLGASSVYVVGDGHAAALAQFGRTAAVGIGPGIHLRLPFVQDVVVYDTRELAAQAEPGDVKTSDGATLRVGFHFRWRVADAATYYRATGGNELQAVQHIEQSVRDALGKAVAAHDRAGLLGSDDAAIDAQVRAVAAAPIRAALGVQLLAVGIGRVLPPDAALASIYKRMNAEAGAAAAVVRTDGAAQAAAVRAQGDAQDEQVVAAANRAAATVRGEGDAAAARIYAAAAAKDPQFFRYWSTLDTWRASFSGGGAVVVLDKDSPFMQALDAGAKAGADAVPKPH